MLMTFFEQQERQRLREPPQAFLPRLKAMSFLPLPLVIVTLSIPEGDEILGFQEAT